MTIRDRQFISNCSLVEVTKRSPILLTFFKNKGVMTHLYKCCHASSSSGVAQSLANADSLKIAVSSFS